VGSWRRVILDSRLRTPPTAQVVASHPELTLIAHTSAAEPADRDHLRAAGVETVEIAADPDGRVSLLALLEDLGRREIRALLVEGGGRVHGSFVDADLVDEAVFFIAPLLLGGTAPCAVAGLGAATLSSALRLRFESIERCGDDLEIRAVRAEGNGVHGVD
jgi:diaminohydroxyphosphoribosylaminopyrimidine deaminase/5-amino-6-(5-phosphoribosylamino)uracil reductase